MSYATHDDYELYQEGFVDEFYGDQTVAANAALFSKDAARFYRRVNEVLKGVSGITVVPIPEPPDGEEYPESIIEWQAKMHICQKIMARKHLEWGDQLPDFILQLKADVRDLERNIMRGNFVFETQTSEAQYGVNAPEPVGDITGTAILHTNFERPVPPYLGEDRARDFLVRIGPYAPGVDDVFRGYIFSGVFSFSTDEGVNWSDPRQCDNEWLQIDPDGVFIRFAYPKGYDRDADYASLYSEGDTWRFRVVPYNHTASPNRRDKRLFVR